MLLKQRKNVLYKKKKPVKKLQLFIHDYYEINDFINKIAT